mgnify:CR=1 FL=1|jgi:hypothetical protein
MFSTAVLEYTDEEISEVANRIIQNLPLTSKPLKRGKCISCSKNVIQPRDGTARTMCRCCYRSFRAKEMVEEAMHSSAYNRYYNRICYNDKCTNIIETGPMLEEMMLCSHCESKWREENGK